MYESLKGKVVVITGAAGSLGTAVVESFHKQGSRLALIERNKEHLVEAFGDMTDTLLISGTDVTNKQQVESAIQDITAHYGRLDALVNIVGGYRAGTPVHETDVADWDFMMNLNAKSVFLMSGAAAKSMIEQGDGGVILSMGAINGLEGGKNSAAYSASKSAVFRLTESLAKELKPHKIRVNAVYPKIIDTPANREAMPDANFDQWVTPRSVSQLLTFLASDQASDVTGALIPILGV